MRDNDIDADVIVVGAGLGGSSTAWQLAEHGLTVLVLEAGPGGTPRKRTRFERVADRLRDATGRSAPPQLPYLSYYTRGTGNSRSRIRPVPTRLGRGVGGSSVLYAAALGRMKRSDFAASRPRTTAEPVLPDHWPISYDAFLRYYRRAEILMRIRGERDPGDTDDDSILLPPPPLSSGAEKVRQALLWNGHLPYRLHVGVDYVPGCIECFGFRCARGCKADGYSRGLERAIATGRVRVETERTAWQIERPAGDRVRVTVRDAEGRTEARTARRLILAGGALNTPLLLERSSALWEEAGRPPMLGRGLMFHLSDAFVVGERPKRGAESGPRKWLSMRDFYDDGSVDVGEIQSIGFNVGTGTVMQGIRFRAARLLGTAVAPVTELLRPFAWIAARLIGPQPMFATITEDLPHASNRVSLENGLIVANYSADPHLRAHARAMRERVRSAFAPLRVRFLTEPGTPSWGHPLGTCRMGTDPATSVTTPEGRVRGHEAIYVADGSVFPSSGGTGPGLTIVALGLRVADHVADELRSRAGAVEAEQG